MQLTWKQRMAARIYKNALSTLALVSPALAARKAFNLMCTPLTPPFRGPLPPLFMQAKEHRIPFNGYEVVGYEFLPEIPNGKTILIAHGFSSFSYKFDGYVLQYQKKGFRILAFDAPGHGRSEGKYLHSLIYRNMLLLINQRLGPVHHYIGHSIAGLAGSLAMETGELKALQSAVLIAPASEANTAFEQFFELIPLPASVKKAIHQIILKTNGQTVEWYSVNRALTSITVPVLWIHDAEDLICPIADARITLEQKPAHVLFCISKGLGHNRIYREGKVKKLIALFIEKGADQASAFAKKDFTLAY